eukprot:1157308-Pelagomonas_calceolata.AAC.19
MGMSAFKENVLFILHIILSIRKEKKDYTGSHSPHQLRKNLEHHIDYRRGKQHHPMWPARLSRYGHEGEIEPHCGQCVWGFKSMTVEFFCKVDDFFFRKSEFTAWVNCVMVVHGASNSNKDDVQCGLIVAVCASKTHVAEMFYVDSEWYFCAVLGANYKKQEKRKGTQAN